MKTFPAAYDFRAPAHGSLSCLGNRGPSTLTRFFPHPHTLGPAPDLRRPSLTTKPISWQRFLEGHEGSLWGFLRRHGAFAYRRHFLLSQLFVVVVVRHPFSVHMGASFIE